MVEGAQSVAAHSITDANLPNATRLADASIADDTGLYICFKCAIGEVPVAAWAVKQLRTQPYQYRTETRPPTLTNFTDRGIAGLTTSNRGVPRNRPGGSVLKTNSELIDRTDHAPRV